MAKSVVIVKKDKKREQTIFIILCILIAILLIGNILAFVFLLSKNTKFGSPSIVSDNKYVIGYLKAGGEYTKNTITFEDELIFPGTQTKKTIRLENTGKSSFYIRIYAFFQVKFEGEDFQTKNFVELIVDDPNWIKSSTDEKVYYLNKLNGKSTVDLDVAIKIYDHLNYQDFEEKYKDCTYRLNVMVETRTNLSLNNSAEEIENSWE